MDSDNLCVYTLSNGQTRQSKSVLLQMSGGGACKMCLMPSNFQRVHVKDTTLPSQESSWPGRLTCKAERFIGCCGFFGMRYDV